MKKVIGTLIGFLSVCFIICCIFGFTVSSPINTFGYKILNSLEYLSSVMPYLLLTGFVVGFSSYYAQDYSGSALRFSEAMMNRFKNVVFVSLACTLILSVNAEILVIGEKNKKAEIENRPKLINEYLKVGNTLYNNKLYQRAIDYANAALVLDKNLREADELKTKATVAYNAGFVEDLRDKLNESYDFDTVDRVDIDSESISEVYKYYLLAEECLENQDWFKAHYYANLGINLATPKDPNLDRLRDISTDAWNNITELQKLDNEKTQLLYEQKYQGYKALVADDYLTAYYIFYNLYNSSKIMQQDPEVSFYLDVAEKKISEKCFFVDETYEMGSFESANDVYFSFTYKDGSRDIIYCKGISVVQSTGDSIQYLRGLSIQTIDENGNFYRSLDVPYAKVLPVSVKSLNQTSKSYLGIDDKTEFVPYIMLKSVSREEGPSTLPCYIYSDGRQSSSPEYMILPVPYKDFITLENATTHPENIPLVQLLKLSPMIDKYGFSKAVYGSTLMDKLLYPLIVFIMFILAACFAWSTRVAANHFFKIIWLLFFPIFFIISGAYYHIILFVYKSINFVCYSSNSSLVGFLTGFLIYVVILLLTSVHFCGKTSNS